MSQHEPTHASWLEQLAAGALDNASGEMRALEACPLCRDEAKATLSTLTRLLALERERREILAEVALIPPDAGLQARVDRSLERALRPGRSVPRHRHWWITLVAATAAIALGTYIARRGASDHAAPDGRGQLLGAEEYALRAPRVTRLADGSVQVDAGRPARPGCVLWFTALDPVEDRVLHTAWGNEATTLISVSLSLGWPGSVEIFVVERNAGGDDVVFSPRVSYSRP